MWVKGHPKIMFSAWDMKGFSLTSCLGSTLFYLFPKPSSSQEDGRGRLSLLSLPSPSPVSLCLCLSPPSPSPRGPLHPAGHWPLSSESAPSPPAFSPTTSSRGRGGGGGGDNPPSIQAAQPSPAGLAGLFPGRAGPQWKVVEKCGQISDLQHSGKEFIAIV